tara:strand:- start:2018 stop:2227 length:210 start_codon:yes stop_codon:yes gene_type:complete
VAFGEAVPAAESEPVDVTPNVVVTAAAGAARGARKRASIERVRASKTKQLREGGSGSALSGIFDFIFIF